MRWWDPASTHPATSAACRETASSSHSPSVATTSPVSHCRSWTWAESSSPSATTAATVTSRASPSSWVGIVELRFQIHVKLRFLTRGMRCANAKGRGCLFCSLFVMGRQSPWLIISYSHSHPSVAGPIHLQHSRSHSHSHLHP